ncbi:MAG: hypothetical protein M3680_06310 [Myxococcota bacterium]|nr:hypothetical protein [Myxococcota bacterium]
MRTSLPSAISRACPDFERRECRAGRSTAKGEVYRALGRIHIELGESPKVKSMFQRGLELEPGNQKLRDALSALS